MVTRPERTNIAGAMAITGMKRRSLQDLAIRGEIPGAAKMGRGSFLSARLWPNRPRPHRDIPHCWFSFLFDTKASLYPSLAPPANLAAQREGRVDRAVEW